MHKFLQSAINLALNHDYDEKLGYFHCAIIYRGGSILSVGYNGLTKNSYVDYLSNFDHSPKPFINMHAEVSAIVAVRNKIDLNGAKCAIARIKPTGVGHSKPCAACHHALKRYGIKKAIYTIDESTFGTMRV